MSSSSEREVPHDPGEVESKQRRSARFNRKYSGSHSKKSSTSKEPKMPKIFKSSSSPERPKLETLYSSNKGSPAIIKEHEDSNINKGNPSSKMSIWGSPDLSQGIEKLFNDMDLSDKSKSLIISINLCNMKNMIQLSNLDLDDISKLFSRKDLLDSDFQDTIVKVLCLGKSFKFQIEKNVD
jgi:hypothetical protein